MNAVIERAISKARREFDDLGAILVTTAFELRSLGIAVEPLEESFHDTSIATNTE